MMATNATQDQRPSDDRRLTEALLYLSMRRDNFPEDDAQILDIVLELAGQTAISPMTGTTMFCHHCYAVNAPGYKLRRAGGKYIALCVDELGGCAGTEVTPQCCFVDHENIQCDQMAEFQIENGTLFACIRHIGTFLKDREVSVFPIR